MEHSGGTPAEHDATLGPGTRLGKYEIVRLLGTGGMGAVYEAAHIEIGKRVAIKVLSPAIAAVPGARARFLREAQLTSRVRHPNIVDVTDMGSDGGQTYLVMEFLRGEDLAQRLARTGPLSPQELADIMLPVCSAVVEAHKAGVTHRDLKPQNIFLALGPHTMQPKVLDFGISKGNDVVGAGNLTGTGALIGTPFYLAPEQIMDVRSAGPQSDQYALGVILYECLTGSRPFDAENLFVVFQAIVNGKPAPPRQKRPDLPSILEEIVVRAMNVDSKARFPTTVALGRALLPFASPRMRSIWEEAFATSDEEVALAAISEPSARVSAPLIPEALVTPSAGSSAVPSAAPSGRSRSAITVAAPAAGEPQPNLSRAAQTPARSVADDSFDDEVAVDFGAGRSRTWKRGAVIGVLLAGGIGGAILALRPAAEPARVAPEAKAPPAVKAPPVAKALPAAKPTQPAAPVVAPPVVAPPAAKAVAPVAPAAVEPAAALASPPVKPKVIRAVKPPVKETVSASPVRRPRPPKSTAPHSLNPNGAPVID